MRLCDRPVDGLDHVAGNAPALRVQHLQADDVRARRHARGLVEAVAAGSGDDPRHVRAVAVLVKSSTAIVGEVARCDDATTELRHLRHTGVDDGDADALAGERPDAGGPAALVDKVRADRLIGHGHVGHDLVIARKLVDRGIVGKCRQRSRGDLDYRARGQTLLDPQPVTHRQVLHLRTRSGDDDARLPNVACAQALREIAGKPCMPPLGRRRIGR